MACLNNLKHDIKTLESLFPRSHEIFQVISASLDELTCRFIGRNGKKFVIHANITETYPSTPPVWFTENEDFLVTSTIETLTTTSGADNQIIPQVKQLVRELCKLHNIKEPLELNRMEPAMVVDFHEEVLESNSEDEADDSGDDAYVEMEDETANQENKDEGISGEHSAMLEKLKQSHRQEHLQGSVTGSVQATDRLMKELKDVYRSDSVKRGVFTVEVVNDCLYEWNVKLLKVDPDSQLHQDLVVLKDKEGRDSILLNIMFKKNYPFEPPFIRVVSPIISGGYVLTGGAICMELLTKQGWSSAYTMEAVILQIAATLVKGKARVQFRKSKGQYSLASAQQTFKSLVEIHERSGWFTPPKADG